VLETTSESTCSEDENKKGIYEKLGVEEYFQFDPLGEYLNPKLQGYRLVGGRYRSVRPNSDGSLLSRTTGVVFRAEGTQLRLTDADSGAPLLRNEEERKARRQAEEALQQAEEKVRALEEELARLRRQI
jgi:hypothetical protein